VIDRANENTARLNLGYSRIVAPVAGRVGLRTVDVGNYIGARRRDGVAVITQLDPIDVEFSVPQDRVPEIQASVGRGAPLAGRRLGPHAHAKLDDGTFSTLDNQIDVQTGTVQAKARFANATNTCSRTSSSTCGCCCARSSGAIVVPVTAMRTGPNGDFRLRPSAAERTGSRSGRCSAAIATNEGSRRGRRASRRASASSPKAAP
jgi:multidrug efflux system membrane fusion protein